MADHPPTLAALFTTLLSTADAATKAALISVLHGHLPPSADTTQPIGPTASMVATIPHHSMNHPPPQPPARPTDTITTNSTTSPTYLDDNNPKDNFILSQSEVAP